MADSASYQLCDFGSGLNCRSIRFRKRLPPTRVCGLCSVVPGKIGALPCGHVLCECCVQGCVDSGRIACPFDGVSFETAKDVFWILLSQEVLSKMEVYCWNAERGCDFVGPAGELLEHYERNCSFHTVSCLRCGEAVLRRELSRHYVHAGCAANNAASSSDAVSREHVQVLPANYAITEKLLARTCHESNKAAGDSDQVAPAKNAINEGFFATKCHDKLSSTQTSVNHGSKGLGGPHFKQFKMMGLRWSDCLRIAAIAAALLFLWYYFFNRGATKVVVAKSKFWFW